jgi:hypothetical protein
LSAYFSFDINGPCESSDEVLAQACKKGATRSSQTQYFKWWLRSFVGTNSAAMQHTKIVKSLLVTTLQVLAAVAAAGEIGQKRGMLSSPEQLPCASSC